LRVFVFPHAGSGASSYHFLARACKDDPVEINLIQYPGREMRIREAPCTDMAAMLASLGEDLRDYLSDTPFAFFGHSMGALVAFELTQRLVESGGPLPQQLFLSGRQAPQRPALNLPVDSMSDAAFLDAVGRRYNALPAELMSNPEILSLLLPSLRADFKLMAGHQYRPAEPLDVGLTLINGTDDPWVDRDSVEAWQAMSHQPIETHWLPGGHFYLPQAATVVRSLLLRALKIGEEAR
jgi:surfactin synthase thioesterase subunit